MKDNKPEAIRLTRREAINIGLGALVGSAVAATGTRAEERAKAVVEANDQEQIALLGLCLRAKCKEQCGDERRQGFHGSTS